MDIESEMGALHLALEYLVAPLIAAHPDREALLEHYRQYRRQVVASRDPTKQALAQLLDRVDASVRALPADFPD